MKTIFIILFFFGLLSCNRSVEFSITNESTNMIDSVVVTNGFDKFTLMSIEPKQNSKHSLIFSDIVKSDGHYNINIYRDSIIKGQGFGYYTNGSPLDKGFEIIIRSDTTYVNSYPTVKL